MAFWTFAGVCCAAAALADANGVSVSAVPSRNDLASTASMPVEAHDRAALPSRQSAQDGAAPQSGKANPLWAIPLESLSATRERPLFAASRRPPPPPVAAAEPVVSAPPPPPPSEPEKPDVLLVGVVHGDHEDMGIFMDQTGRSVLRLRVGQADRGWVVQSVDLRGTTLEKNQQQVKLELPARNTNTAGEGTPIGALALTNPLARFPIRGQQMHARGP